LVIILWRDLLNAHRLHLLGEEGAGCRIVAETHGAMVSILRLGTATETASNFARAAQ
jgi:hypothetical protein